MGGVIEKVHFYKFCEEILSKKTHEKDIHKIIQFEKKLRHKLDASEITLDFYLEQINQHFKTNYSKNEYILDIRKYTDFDEKLFEFIKNNLKNKYKLYILSNNSELFIDNKIKKKISEVFEKQFYSFELKERKPEIKIYEIFIKKTKLKSEECLFIDDKERNLLPAKELGFQTYQYKNLEELKQKLFKL